MRNIQYLTIDINKKTQQDVTANEGEIGSRFLKIKITDSNVPVDLTGTKVYLYALKSDNTKLFNLVEIVDATQGVVLGELTSQLLTSPGVVKLTLVLTEGTKKLISKEFSLKVDDSIFDDDAIESTNEFTALTRSLNKVDEWNGYFEETSGQIEQKYTERLNEHDAQFISIQRDMKNILDRLTLLEGSQIVDTFAKILIGTSEWNVLGDSITAGYSVTVDKTYHQLLKNEYSIATVNNYGISSSTIANKNNGYCIRYANMSATADLITVFGGVNDFLHNVPIGNVDDVVDTTFYGGLKKLIAGLKGKYPTSKIIFFTPLKVKYGTWTTNVDGTNTIGVHLQVYVDIIKELCFKNGIKVIDLFEMNNLNPNIDSVNTALFADTLHPNVNGHIELKESLKASVPAIPSIDESVAVTGVTLNKTSITGFIGDSVNLVATITPSNATNKNIVWSSSDSTVATVNSSGFVNLLKVGSAIINAITVDGNKVANCSITVKADTIVLRASFDALNYSNNKITDSISSLTMNIGGSPVLSDGKLVFSTYSDYSIDVSSLNLSSTFDIEIKLVLISTGKNIAYNLYSLGEQLTENSWSQIAYCYKNNSYNTTYSNECVILCHDNEITGGLSNINIDGDIMTIRICRDSNNNIITYINNNQITSYVSSKKINYIFADSTKGFIGKFKSIKIYE